MTEILPLSKILLYCTYALTSLLFSVLLAGVDLPDIPQQLLNAYDPPRK